MTKQLKFRGNFVNEQRGIPVTSGGDAGCHATLSITGRAAGSGVEVDVGTSTSLMRGTIFLHEDKATLDGSLDNDVAATCNPELVSDAPRVRLHGLPADWWVEPGANPFICEILPRE